VGAPAASKEDQDDALVRKAGDAPAAADIADDVGALAEALADRAKRLANETAHRETVATAA
jgi:hypothetical protein